MIYTTLSVYFTVTFSVRYGYESELGVYTPDPVKWPRCSSLLPAYHGLEGGAPTGDSHPPSSGSAEACRPTRPLSLPVPPAVAPVVLLPVLPLGLLDPLLVVSLPLALAPLGGSGVPALAPAPFLVFFFFGPWPLVLFTFYGPILSSVEPINVIR